MEPSTEKIDIHRGLKGVYFDRSKVCYIDGRNGELRYRGYSIHDLAEHSSFEEVTYLLMYGELPTRAQLDAFDAELKAARVLDPANALPDHAAADPSMARRSRPVAVREHPHRPFGRLLRHRSG